MSRTTEATEVRSFATTDYQFRAVAEGRSMIGLVAPYNVISDVGAFTETLKPGVFAKSIREAARSLPLHVMHKHDEVPVGKAIGWTEETRGLIGEFLFDTRAEAVEAARLAEEGLLSSMSVGFLPLPSGSVWDFSGDKPHVTRTEARFLETSLVSVPVSVEAGVIAMRSAGVPNDPRTKVVPTPRLHDAKAWLESIRR